MVIGAKTAILGSFGESYQKNCVHALRFRCISRQSIKTTYLLIPFSLCSILTHPLWYYPADQLTYDLRENWRWCGMLSGLPTWWQSLFKLNTGFTCSGWGMVDVNIENANLHADEISRQDHMLKIINLIVSCRDRMPTACIESREIYGRSALLSSRTNQLLMITPLLPISTIEKYWMIPKASRSNPIHRPYLKMFLRRKWRARMWNWNGPVLIGSMVAWISRSRMARRSHIDDDGAELDHALTVQRKDYSYKSRCFGGIMAEFVRGSHLTME